MCAMSAFHALQQIRSNIAGLAPSVLGFDKDTGYDGMPEWLEAAISELEKKHQAKLPIRIAETNISPKEMPSPQRNKSLPTSSNHQSSSISRCNLLVEGKLTISIHLNLGGRQHQHGFSHQVQNGSLKVLERRPKLG